MFLVAWISCLVSHGRFFWRAALSLENAEKYILPSLKRSIDIFTHHCFPVSVVYKMPCFTKVSFSIVLDSMAAR